MHDIENENAVIHRMIVDIRYKNRGVATFILGEIEKMTAHIKMGRAQSNAPGP